jgi:hypothetical protein
VEESKGARRGGDGEVGWEVGWVGRERLKEKGRKKKKREEGMGRGIWTPMFQTDQRHGIKDTCYYIKISFSV